jgi:hypothetical protein
MLNRRPPNSRATEQLDEFPSPHWTALGWGDAA